MQNSDSILGYHVG